MAHCIAKAICVNRTDVTAILWESGSGCDVVCMKQIDDDNFQYILQEQQQQHQQFQHRRPAATIQNNSGHSVIGFKYCFLWNCGTVFTDVITSHCLFNLLLWWRWLAWPCPDKNEDKQNMWDKSKRIEKMFHLRSLSNRWVWLNRWFSIMNGARNIGVGGHINQTALLCSECVLPFSCLKYS